MGMYIIICWSQEIAGIMYMISLLKICYSDEVFAFVFYLAELLSR
jgi:hypothetical protein